VLVLGAVPSDGTALFFCSRAMKISAIIITFNEQRHLAQCLESLRSIVDELVVVDSGSQDQTLEIASRYGARTCVRQWTNYSDQKNFAASLTSNDWILSVDADECLSPALRDALLTLKTKEPTASAFEFSRKALYLGRWIQHSGWYPDFKKRLYLRSKGRWDGAFVHESLVIDGPVERLPGDLLHYTCESVSEHLNSLDRYTTLAAQDLLRRGQRSSPLNSLLSALTAFLKSYVLKQGFRDGIQGFLIAFFASYYNFAKYAKLWELEQKRLMASGSSSFRESGET
jgi:glycosyltransferase involved in cell wall biosynthesis